MRLPKSVASLLATAVCALAACNAHAQSATNNVTFTLTETQQGAETPFIKGTNSNFIKLATQNAVLNTAGIIAELSHATNMHFTVTSEAKLVLVLGGSNPQFAVSEGANFFLIDTNVMNLSQLSDNTVFSGIAQGFLPAPSIKGLLVSELDFNDVSMGASDLHFSLRGIESITVSGVKISQASESESVSVKIGLAGGGSVGSTNFVATGNLSASGSGLIIP